MTKEKKQKTTEKIPKEKDQLELKELLQRTQANFENYRKQQEKRITEIREMAAKDVILQILPIIDNFELALKNAETNTNPKDFLTGVELIYSQLHSLLENNNIKTIETKNKQFDPFYHEALLKVDSELPENTIVEELQKGFILHDKVIRHTKVKISAGKKKTEEQNQ
ncbi:MAG: nucleotide exchange factor GrpE [Nanoarchaeota archaeon]|nr:nucleotide exchange factor GrpE [Nanoarchaeota archaeon]MBU1622512.1 nucleotide exchange factor GrpE [Nanoarchaeota archaeon]